MIMVCTDYQDLTLDSFDGALSREQREALQTHLAGCPGCREFWQAQRDLDAALATRLSGAALSPDFEQRVLERLRLEGQPRRFWYLPQLLDLAGYSALAAAGGYVLFSLTSQPALEAAFPKFATYASWAAATVCGLYLLWASVKPETRT
jgi:anti-sigma factor RsiW